MKKLALAGLAAAAAMLGGIAPVVATAPQASAATLPPLPQSTRQLAHNAELNARPNGLLPAQRNAASGPVTTMNNLFGDSCVSQTMCMAVGIDGSTLAPAAEVFNGGGWSEAAGTIPAPAGTTADYLQDVSCRPTTFCVAVGEYSTGSTSSGSATGAGLAEIWNGSTWTFANDLTPGGAGTGLTGVSCPNTHQCVTVGVVSADGRSGTPVADTWNGSTWVKTPTPKIPGGAFLTELTGVSCWNGTNCIASGFYQTGTESNETGEGPIAEEWNGKTWTLISPARPGLQSWLNGITCLSASDCMAVGGYYKTATHFAGFTEQWNGKTWKAILSPSLANQGDSALASVSCLSSGDCNAVGTESIDLKANTVEDGKAAAVHWNGTSLTLTSPAGLTNEDDVLFHVSCKAANFCAGVGSFGPVNSNNSADTSWFWNSTHWKQIAAL